MTPDSCERSSQENNEHHAKDEDDVTGTIRRWKLEHALSNVTTLQRGLEPQQSAL
jgi:hypothetical protein